ncbi:4-hydroxy-tetrahydrodipicolinate synthase [Myxococcota bacterium]|jgi:4-hydroxy-tetrahydrodipicolinate synthase|nr:4-hydroxy-tetrahydrodipicolinate synthase [Myxococcota bacterium]
MNWQGVFTALITPFDGGEVDFPSLRELVRRQIAAGIHGLVACGTTGEPASLTAQEWDRVVATVIETAGGRVPVLAGTGTHGTRTTVERTRRARELGADGALVVTPYYVRPQQEGLVEHFRTVAREGGLPVMLYDVPGRTGVHLAPSSVGILSRVPGIVALKDASGSPTTVREVRQCAAPEFRVLSGDDGLALAAWALGAEGVVSVASNVAPAQMVELWDHWKAGRIAQARETDLSLAPLYRALFLESSPAPAKAAASILGLCRDEVRLPLVPASRSTREALEAALATAGLR